MDQYWMRHPDEFFGRPHEHARVALANPYILADHLLCAAFERPLELDETAYWFGEAALPVVEGLIERGELTATAAYMMGSAVLSVGASGVFAASTP